MVAPSVIWKRGASCVRSAVRRTVKVMVLSSLSTRTAESLGWKNTSEGCSTLTVASRMSHSALRGSSLKHPDSASVPAVMVVMSKKCLFFISLIITVLANQAAKVLIFF